MNMIWLASVVLSFVLIKLGAMSVLVSVLALSLKVALLVILVLIGLLIWRRFRSETRRILRKQ